MKKESGLTLIELVVALAVLAIVVAVGAPRLQNLSSGNKLTSIVNTLSGDFAYARSEAATRNRVINLVSSSGNDWSQGWQVLDGATVLRTQPPIYAGATLDSTVGTISFNPDGSQAGGLLTFWACDPSLSGKARKELGINATGRHHYTTGVNCP